MHKTYIYFVVHKTVVHKYMHQYISEISSLKPLEMNSLESYIFHLWWILSSTVSVSELFMLAWAAITWSWSGKRSQDSDKEFILTDSEFEKVLIGNSALCSGPTALSVSWFCSDWLSTEPSLLSFSFDSAFWSELLQYLPLYLPLLSLSPLLSSFVLPSGLDEFLDFC